ncbi:MAG: chromate efflux transporter [Gammaproteobacteria bacterium]
MEGASSTTDPASAPRAPTASEAFGYWLRLGFISFGGPAGQIAIMHRDLVERRRWISERRFLHALNYCMLLPGPEAQQLATYIGWLLHGTRGGIVAGALFVLPSLFILIVLSWMYLAFGHLPAVAAVLYGIKPAVVAIVVAAGYRVGTRALRSALMWVVAAAAFAAIVSSVPFPLVVLAAGLAGALGARLRPDAFAAGAGHGAARIEYGPAVIDDATPVPAHARFSRGRMAQQLAVGLGIGLSLFAVLLAAGGWHATLTQIGWFFTKAALLTFGGAYAVLPYVYQGAVDHYGWLQAGQMIDGLALGESTPGPLIMVVAFVGFVAAWTQAIFGPADLLAAGIAGAGVATFFTFLPSFLFILAGGPLVEATRGDLRFTAPLGAITAAVVGVIGALAVFFASHVFWPHGPAGGTDAVAILIALGAGVALMYYRMDVIPVLALSALAGLVRWLAMQAA